MQTNYKTSSGDDLGSLFLSKTGHITFIFKSSTTFTVPDNATKAFVILTGGGGGGNTVKGGGGGGTIIATLRNLNPGIDMYVSIGSSGAGSYYSSQSASDGGGSALYYPSSDQILYAAGGHGGTVDASQLTAAGGSYFYNAGNIYIDSVLNLGGSSGHMRQYWSVVSGGGRTFWGGGTQYRNYRAYGSGFNGNAPGAGGGAGYADANPSATYCGGSGAGGILYIEFY